jgi:hypothetical protein
VSCLFSVHLVGAASVHGETTGMSIQTLIENEQRRRSEVPHVLLRKWRTPADGDTRGVAREAMDEPERSRLRCIMLLATGKVCAPRVVGLPLRSLL